MSVRLNLSNQKSTSPRAIAARLIDRAEPDAEERLALNDALRALHVLIEEARKRVPQEEPKEDTA
jgi:hypothetical protein